MMVIVDVVLCKNFRTLYPPGFRELSILVNDKYQRIGSIIIVLGQGGGLEGRSTVQLFSYLSKVNFKGRFI